MVVEDDTDFPGSRDACHSFDWEPEEDTVGVFCGNPSNRKRKRAHITVDSDTDSAF